MRKMLVVMTAVAGLVAVVAPMVASASEHTNCNNVPKAEWAQCILDQAASQSSD